MAFDFPASPALNQVFNAPTGQGYIWNGTVWNLAQTSPQAPVASDAPPSNPYAGQLWFKSSTGTLYMWYVDPNSSQWVQIPGISLPAGDAGKIDWFAMVTPPNGWLKANGVGVLRATYPNLDAAIYCGDANNPTAGFGFHCTDATAATRSLSGTYLALPDLRAEVVRGFDDGRGLDASRVFGSAQADDVKSHTHTQQGSFTSGTESADHTHALTMTQSGAVSPGYGLTASVNFQNAVIVGQLSTSTGGRSAAHTHTTTISGQTGGLAGTETRAHNVALLACIKY